MSFRYPAGLITASSPVNANYPSGVWTPRQALPYLQNNVWGQDSFFDQTVLLLHGDGTNGAQNNTFLDSSSNNFTITRNGNITQGTFTPFSLAAGEWSNYFDGNGDELSIASNSVFDPGTGNFTVEAWVNVQQITTANYLVNRYQAFTGGRVFYLATNAGGFPTFLLYNYATQNTGSGFKEAASPTALVVGTWNHLAGVRSGDNLYIFVNGELKATTTGVSSFDAYGTSPVQIGAYNYSGVTSFANAYISNARIVKGTAVYTSAFTPPTAPLTAITNTSLLTCQSNRFVDNSTNNFTVTPSGDARVTPFSPFQPLLAYSPGVTGGSGYFDGTGDYLQTTSTQIIPASTTYTIEAWVYLTGSYADYREIVCQGTSGNAGRVLLFVDITSGELRVQIGATGIASGVTIVPNQWYYVAFRNNGGSYNLYVNGVSVASGTNTTTPQNTSLTIGAFSSGAEYWQGYISDVRISNTARTITLPTAPFSSDANTRLLTNFTNAGILDNTAKNVLETVGNAQIDTAVVKYGTGAMEFDGSGDFISIPDSPFWDLGGNYTIEMWLYPTSNSSQTFFQLGSTSNILLYKNASNVIIFYSGSAIITASSAITLNTWIHVALVRNGTGSNNTVLYLNGVNVGQATNTTSFTGNASNGVRIGAEQPTGFEFTGFIDDLRITKGIARYTANFVPPIARFPNQ